MFRRGFQIEDRVVALLEKSGFMVKRDATLDHRLKLDFVVVSFPENLSFQAVGVQVTSRRDEAAKQDEFLRVNEKDTRIPKVLYLEIDESVDLETGGAALMVSALMNYQFNRAYCKTRIMGATIFPDGFGFFDVAERVKRLHSLSVPQLPISNAALTHAAVGTAPSLTASSLSAPSLSAPGPVPVPARPLAVTAAASAPATAMADRQGVLETYNRSQGYGFILSAEGDKYFMHVSQVSDETLKERLNHLPSGETYANVGLHVMFKPASKLKPEDKYEQAHQVRLIA